jgi:hypothetical protein
LLLLSPFVSPSCQKEVFTDHAPSDPVLLKHMMVDLIPLVYLQADGVYVCSPSHLTPPTPSGSRHLPRKRYPNSTWRKWLLHGCARRLVPPTSALVDTRVVRESTLAGALSEFIAAVQLILKLPVEECGPDSRYIWFAIHNRHEMHEGMHTCLVRHSPLSPPPSPPQAS